MVYIVVFNDSDCYGSFDDTYVFDNIDKARKFMSKKYDKIMSNYVMGEDVLLENEFDDNSYYIIDYNDNMYYATITKKEIL